MDVHVHPTGGNAALRTVDHSYVATLEASPDLGDDAVPDQDISLGDGFAFGIYD
jgi:hypothetical protein